jgi:2-phosphoglycolate phosphatase
MSSRDTIDTGIECVLFDLDGTLVDTAADFQRVLDTMLDQRNLPRVSSERVHQTVSDGARALVSLAFNLEESDAEFGIRLEQLLDLYYAQLERTAATPYPGILSLLDKLENSAIAWGVVTNKPEKYSLRLLENLQLLERCGSLICPEHVLQRKPDPESLLLACRQLERNTERTVYIGDHMRDMQAAKNADIIAIAAAYGYLGPDTSVSEWPADFAINSIAELENLLTILKFA